MEAGKKFSNFVLLRQLGKGGMGEVYLAEDQRLGRKVALKFLPQEFVQNADRLRRFELEARAASALNHPNIVTIFEVGQAEGNYFIASEYIEGETLRDKLKASIAIPISQAVDIATQIAAALVAAHAAKIFHRDIKPENIMIRPDGYVKVLDFGLAKQQDLAASAMQASALPTFAQTEPGTVVGTVHYMSPEQARGLELDPRTDLFSLGVVLYEMVTGRIPFQGATRTDVVVSILRQEPAQLSTHLPDVPPELEWIVNKALRKDREERYQTAREMQGDLKGLQPKIGSQGAEISSRARLSTVSSGSAPTTTSSAEYLVTELRKHKKVVFSFLLIAALIAGLFLWKQWRTTAPTVPATGESIRISRLTTSGAVGKAAISPDGKLVAYSLQLSGKESMWLKQVSTGSNISIVRPENVYYGGLDFSPDGQYLYITKSENEFSAASLYKMPVLGGPITKVLDHIDSPPSISPDGKRIAFVRWETNQLAKLITANIDGTSPKTQIEARSPKFIDTDKVAWSSDGSRICFTGGEGEELPSIYTTVVDSGKQTMLTRETWGDFHGFVWRKDGSGLVMSAAHRSTNYYYQIWFLSYPQGVARRLTNDPNNYIELSGTSDSTTFVAVQNDRLADIYITSADDTSALAQITNERYDGRTGVAWTPDGNVLFGDRHFDLWLIAADGSNRRLLTPDEHSNRYPYVTPDGKHLIFESWRKSDRGQGCGLWKMNIDGTNAQLLAFTRCYATASCSGDCSSLLFDYYKDGSGIWKTSIAGGEPAQVIKEETYKPALSPDGSKIACLRVKAGGSDPEIAIYPAVGGSALKTFVPEAVPDGKPMRWTPDSKSIVYTSTQQGVTNLWQLPVDGGKPRQITRFEQDQILSFDWASDGKIVIARGKNQNDVMLMTLGD